MQRHQLKNPFFPILAAAVVLLPGLANATTSGAVSWNGTVDGDWTNAANWSSATAPVTGEAPTTRAIRINLNNGLTNPLIYSAAQGHTIYTGDGNNRALGGNSGTGGSMTITGGTFETRTSSQDFIGNNQLGNATYVLTIDGGTFTNINGTNTEFLLGFNGTQTVRLDMKSGSFITGSLRVGAGTSSNINATINLDGGTLATGFITRQGSGNNIATINFNGGILQARTNTTTFINTAVQNANILAGGAVIDTNGFNITIPKALTGGAGDGGLTKTGAGTLTLTAANSYTGETLISGGTLLLSGTGSIADSSIITVGSGATLDVSGVAGGWQLGASQTLAGSGTVAGGVTINGTHSPGNSAGLQTFTDGLSYAAGSSVIWELFGNDIGVRGTDFDAVNVSGGPLDFSGPTTLNLAFDAAGSGVDWTDSFWKSNHTGTDGWLVYQTSEPILNFGNLSLALSSWNDSNGLALNSALPIAEFQLFQSGHDIYLNFITPEPSRTMLAAIGLLALTARRRR